MNPITILLIVIVAFLAGMEGILDEFEFHQPLVACTLIGLVSGHLTEGIMLGGSLQLMALGWANIGAAVAPDAALASVASAILMVLGLNGGRGVFLIGQRHCKHKFVGVGIVRHAKCSVLEFSKGL